MIKVTFKEPQFVIQHGIESWCLFCYCFETLTIKNTTSMLFSDKKHGSVSDVFHTPFSNIKSIKHVKPTDL